MTVTPPFLLGGCSDEGEDSLQVGLGRVSMTNRRESATEVRVEIEKGGDVLYDQTHDVAGADDGFPGSVEITEAWMGESANYTVTASILGSDHVNSFSSKDADEFVSDWGDAECYSVSIVPEDDGVYFAVGTLESCP